MHSWVNLINIFIKSRIEMENHCIKMIGTGSCKGNLYT